MALSSAAAFAAKPGEWKCEKGQLRFGGTGAEDSSYCYRPEPNQLLSKNCHSGKCELIDRIRKADDKVFREEVSPVGNPEFRLCRKLGGTPRVLEFRAEGKWKSFNECRFAGDNSFANVDFLYYMGKRLHVSLQEE